MLRTTMVAELLYHPQYFYNLDLLQDCHSDHIATYAKGSDPFSGGLNITQIQGSYGSILGVKA